MNDRTVRPAVSADAEALGAVQQRAWASAYAGILPDDLLAGLAPEAIAAEWTQALGQPPSPRHTVYVATEDRVVTGFLALGPASDPDTTAEDAIEVGVVAVEPSHWGRGHGSRLLTAALETAATEGTQRAYAWVPGQDVSGRRFLTGAGWEPDGASRTWDVRGDGSALVEEIRLHVALG